MRALCGWDSLIPGINPMATCLARCRCSADGSWVNECPHWTAAATEAQKVSVTYPKSHSSERPRRAWSPCCESKEEKRSGPVSRVSHPSTNQAWRCLVSEIRWDQTCSEWHGGRLVSRVTVQLFSVHREEVRGSHPCFEMIFLLRETYSLSWFVSKWWEDQLNLHVLKDFCESKLVYFFLISRTFAQDLKKIVPK